MGLKLDWQKLGRIWCASLESDAATRTVRSNELTEITRETHDKFQRCQLHETLELSDTRTILKKKKHVKRARFPFSCRSFIKPRFIICEDLSVYPEISCLTLNFMDQDIMYP